MRAALLAVVTVAALLPMPSNAASLKCGSDMVSDGATRYEVWRKCGDPVSQETRTVYDSITISDGYGGVLQRQVSVVIEEWIYSTGSTNFDQHVTFRDGRLVEVRSGNYGR